MPEPKATKEYYYLHEEMEASYTVTVKKPPADSADVTFRKRTQKGVEIAKKTLVKTGSSTVKFKPKDHSLALGDSPVWAMFAFKKSNWFKPNAYAELAISLAEPAVFKIKVPAETERAKDVTFEVEKWAALAQDLPLPTRPTKFVEKDTARIPADVKNAVKWKVAGKELTGKKGERITVKVDDDWLGKEVEVEAWIGDAPNPACRATALMKVKGLTLKGKLYWKRTWDYSSHPPDGTPPKRTLDIKEFLPGAKVLLSVKGKGDPGPKQVGGDHWLTTADSVTLKGKWGEVSEDVGAFEFKDVPHPEKALIRIDLEHKDGKYVVAKGHPGATTEYDELHFQLKKNEVIWYRFELDHAAVDKDKTKTEIDLGDVEIKRKEFVDVCDSYKTVWFGHHRIKALSGGKDLPVCPITYPLPTGVSCANSKGMQITADDPKDRDVLLHEYGHFTGDVVLGGFVFKGYMYNDDPGHNTNTLEHYESAWLEGHATFLACAMNDRAVYHDGWATDNLTFNLQFDYLGPGGFYGPPPLGGHSEGSIQGALWRILKSHRVDFKTGFWAAFSDQTKRKITNVFDLFDTWKDLGLPHLGKVLQAYRKFGMEHGYRYEKKLKCKTGAAGGVDEVKGEFENIQQLWDKYGKTGGGTYADYRDEFYNRNKYCGGGNVGDSRADFIADDRCYEDSEYIVPERFTLTEAKGSKGP